LNWHRTILDTVRHQYSGLALLIIVICPSLEVFCLYILVVHICAVAGNITVVEDLLRCL